MRQVLPSSSAGPNRGFCEAEIYETLFLSTKFLLREIFYTKIFRKILRYTSIFNWLVRT